MTTAEKFRAVRKSLGMRQAEFAEPLGVGHKQISAIETGAVGPSDSVMELLFLRHRVSREWWESGDGPMFDEDPPHPPDHLKPFFDEIARMFPTPSSLVENGDMLAVLVRSLWEMRSKK